MSMTNLNVRTDSAVKAEAERIYSALGLNMSTAINMFLRQSIIENGIPFDVKLNTPNAITAAAIPEGRSLMNDPNADGFHSMEALKAALYDEA